jgi:amino acid adenylation domain-containing protein
MLKKRAEAVAPREQPIPRRPVGEAVPLSFNQEILWVLDQLMPGGTAYNVPRATRLFGKLDVAALKRALDTIVARHEALRTTYKDVGGTPIQVINPEAPVDLRITDLLCLSDAERAAEAQRLLVQGARYRFDLSRDQMLRADLLKLSEQEHILLLVTHHIASDGWSKALLFREFAALYDAFARGLSSPLPEVPLQYADFALFQRGLFQGGVLDEQLAYWKKKLAGAPAMIDLPLDHPRPPVQSYRGLRQALLIPRPLVDALRALSQKEGATLFMVLLAAFQTLLFRYTHQEDIVVGTPIAGRNRKDIEGIIGLFTNTLVMRTDFSNNPTFREMMKRVREVALGAYDHQDLPFEKLVMELKPDRTLSHAPLFQVMFVLQNNPTAERQPEGLSMTPIKIERGSAKFDLLLSLTEHAEGLTGSLEYATDLFEAATMTRLRGHFRTLLEAIVKNPDEKVASLPLLTEGERHQLLAEWNQTKADYPSDKCLHEMVEAQVVRTPLATAVIAADGQTLTYRELNERANQLAHFIRRRGVGPEIKVGICVERSLEMVVGLLGILKAGGACLPLDPAYPKDRQSLMIEEGAVHVLLTQARLAPALPPSRAEIIFLDTDSETIEKESTENPVSGVKPENIGYVLFTSGSTGKPKGVLLHHLGLVNTCAGVIDGYGYKQTDRILQFASVSFDVHIEEIFPSFMVGATVLFRNDEMIASTTYFSRWIKEHGITVIDLPTAYWHEWVRDLATSGHALPEALCTVIVGGEQASMPAYAAWVKVPGGRRVRWLNTVAPTECTVVSTIYEGDPHQGEIPAELPIGRPMGNVTCYVLDPNQNPVPIGVSGEWVIGGRGVARGYLHRPEQTAAAFIRDPWSDAPGARLYRTGDRARYLPDGNIVLMGRLDHQVKIRGFRIELGEIETVLGQHPAVGQNIVIARDDEPGQKRLVAYVVFREGQSAGVSSLKSFLKEKLPEYMVPSAFVVLEALPMTENGKVFRKALPAPERSGFASEGEFVAPRTPVEEILTQIWAEVLGIPRVGVFDNFFDLGGHSLLATRVVSRVRDAFEIELPLRRLFEMPTVDGLAIAVIEGLAERSLSEETGSDLAAAEFSYTP